MHLPFIFSLHLLGLSLEDLIGILDLLDLHEGLLVFELEVVTRDDRTTLLAHR